MGFSSFDRRLLEEGLAYFEQPPLASLLEWLGTSRMERADVLVTMLRNASAEEYEEALALFDRAVSRAERERERLDRDDRDRHDRDRHDHDRHDRDRDGRGRRRRRRPA